MKFKVVFNFLMQQMNSDRTGTDKNHPDVLSWVVFQTKHPLTKPPDKNPREQLRQNLYKGALSGFFVLLKIGWGSEMCDVLSGGPGMCDEV